MIAVFYNKSTGRITESVMASEDHIKAQNRPYLEVDVHSPAYDATHLVLGGKLVERDANAISNEQLVAAITALRVERDRRLEGEVDPLVTNPLRWGELSDAQKAKVSAHRLKLLNIPQTTKDPHNPVWPVLDLKEPAT